jgi:phasin family protein
MLLDRLPESWLAASCSINLGLKGYCSMPAQTTAQPTDFTKVFTQFATSGFPTDHVVLAQRRNFEAVVAATQVTAESWLTVYRRQVEIFTQAAVEGTNELQHLLSPGAPEEKLAQHADVLKVTFEKGLTNLREVSQILTKANTEATDVLSKRVTESLTEMKGIVAKTQPTAKVSALAA